MSESQPDSDLSLLQFLSARARHASDARLALDVACGLVAALAAVFWRGPAWQVITSGAVCFLAYGAWGIADRELTERVAHSSAPPSGLRVGKTAAAIVGGIAGASFVMTALFFLLGTIKS